MPVDWADRIPRTHCVECGKELTPTQQSKRSQRCSKECYYKATGGAPVLEHTCEGCGETFKPTGNDRTTYCSRECYFSNKAKTCPTCGKRMTGQGVTYCSTECALQDVECVICGKVFQGRANAAYCSVECRKEKGRQDYHDAYVSVRESAPFVEKVCAHCGGTFSVNFHVGRRIYCSSKCGKRVVRAVRRARMRGSRADRIGPLAVLRRDKWTCQTCGVKTPRRLRGTLEDNAPELDHVVPLSLGGTHTWDNLQCLCRRCNHDKGATVRGQLGVSVLKAQGV